MSEFANLTHPAYPPGQEWADWVPFPRSSNVAAARYKLDAVAGLGIWQVIFGGKERKATRKHAGGGITPLVCYEYGPSVELTDALFWQWWNQYVAGGSAGIWLDLNVKRIGIASRKAWSQGS